MPVTNIKSKWKSGDLVFTDNDGTELLSIESDGTIDVKTAGGLVQNNTQTLIASGAVLASTSVLELNSATTSGAITATIADLTLMAGSLFIKDNSAGGTAEKTVTAAAGTFDGTNNVLTFNAPKEAIMLQIDSAGNGTIIENVGSVAIS